MCDFARGSHGVRHTIQTETMYISQSELLPRPIHHLATEARYMSIPDVLHAQRLPRQWACSRVMGLGLEKVAKNKAMPAKIAVY